MLRAQADHRVHHPGLGDRPDPRAPPRGGARDAGRRTPVGPLGVVRSAVLDDHQASSAAPVIPVFRGGRGLHAGVDLDSNAALFELMGDDQL